MNSVLSPQEAERCWDDLYPYIKNSFPDHSAFKAMDRFISPPPTLNGLARICQNFLKIIPYLYSIQKSQETPNSWSVSLPAWQQLCRLLVENAYLIDQKIPGFADQGGTSPPYRGFYESHCLGVALWCRPPDAMEEPYFILQGILCILADAIRVRSAHEHISLSSQLSAGCLVVRKLANTDYEDYLKQLPDIPSSLVAYQAHLSNLLENAAGNLSEHPLYPLHHLIDLALHKTDPQKRESGGVRRRTQTAEHTVTDTITLGTLDDDAPQKVEINRTTRITGDQKTEEMRAKALLTPLEFTHQREVFSLTHTGGDPSGGFNTYQQKLKVKEALRCIAIRNQMLPFAMERLSTQDIEIFLKELKLLSTCSDVIQGVPCQALAAFLAIGFWTSRPLQDIVNTTVTPALSDVKANLAIYHESPSRAYFVVTPAIPRLKKSYERSAERQALPLARQFCLAAPPEAWDCIAQWSVPFLHKYTEQRIFNLDPGLYQAASDTFLKKLRRTFDCRLNIDRVLLHLHNQISQLDRSDITLAMAISGRNDLFGKVPLHYTAHHVSTICRAYQSAVEAILQRTVNNDQAKTTEIYAGSRFVPKRDVVKTLITKMRDRLHTLRSTQTGQLENFAAFHNVYTSYTVMMVGFSTGYRAVHDPLLQDAEIDDESGLAAISDKVTNDFYQSRLIWLPPLCRQQLKKYSEHQNWISHALFRCNQELFFRSRECGSSGKGSNRTNPGLFYLDIQNNAVDVRPGSLDRYLRHVQFALPVNANRHYLRTHLLAMGCPLEALSAFMGHWEMGLEPWGRYSGLSPATYCRELSKFLPRLLEEDGWDVEPGLA